MTIGGGVGAVLVLATVLLWVCKQVAGERRKKIDCSNESPTFCAVPNPVEITMNAAQPEKTS